MTDLQTELLRYFDQRSADLHLAFMESRREVRKGNVHALRVAMKRIRAFFQMLDAVDPYFTARFALDQIKPPFREAGQLRDLQIVRALISEMEEKYALEAWSSSQLQALALARQEAFEEFLQSFSLAGLREACLQARYRLELCPSDILREGLRRYFAELLGEIARLWREGISSRKRLHDLRKKVKEVSYNLTAADQALGHAELPAELFQKIDQLQHLLGKWHDFEVALAALGELLAPPDSLRLEVKREEERYLQDTRILLATSMPLSDELRSATELLLPLQSTEIC
jgi:CHAD domain-containing protein